MLIWLSVALATAPGDPIDLAAALHVSQAGFDHLASGMAGVFPTALDIAGVSTSFACDPADVDPLAFTLPALHAGLVTDEVRITPLAGGLHLTLDLGLTLEAEDVAVSGSCTFLLRDVDYTCSIETGAPIDVRLDVDLMLDLTAEGAFDATVTGFDVALGPIANPLQGCRRLRDFFDTLSVLGLDSADTANSNPQFFTGLVESFIDPELESLPAELETAVEDALTFLPLTTSVDLLGAPLDVELYATALRVDATGLFIGLGATLNAPWDPTCVQDGEDDNGDPIAPQGPDLSVRGWPDTGNTAYGAGSLPYDAALFLGRDFVEQAGFVVWQSGLFCMDVAELSPIPLGTGLLGTMLGETFRELFPEDGPAALTLRGDEPPTVDFPQDTVVELGLGGLVLDVAGPLDARDALVCSTGIDALATLGVGITDGALTLDLGIDPAEWSFDERSHELLPPGYSDGLKTGLPTILNGILTPDLLPTIPLPAWQGIGVGGVSVLPSDDGQWQGLFLSVDVAQPEPIVLEGCSSGCDGGDAGLDLEAALGCTDDAGCGGCSGDDASCADSGCSLHGRGVARLWPVSGAILLVWLRRRRAS